MKKVLIGIPSNGQWASRTAFCVNRLTNYCQSVGIQTILSIQDSSKLPDNRNRLALQAIELGCDYLFFIDADMIFPADALERLIAADVDIIGSNYVTRNEKIRFTATGLDGLELLSTYEKSGIQEAGYIATGLLLIKTDVFKRLELPYFMFAPNITGKDLVGEDYYFCHIAREAGYKVHIDHDISKETGHIAQVVLTYEHHGITASFQGFKNDKN